MNVLQLIIILASIVFVLIVCWQVASGRLLLRYSLLWLVLALFSILLAIFPGMVVCVAAFLGFEAPSNFVFFAILFFLIIIILSLSVVVSRQAMKLKSVIQTLALLEKRYEEDLKSLTGDRDE